MNPQETQLPKDVIMSFDIILTLGSYINIMLIP